MAVRCALLPLRTPWSTSLVPLAGTAAYKAPELLADPTISATFASDMYVCTADVTTQSALFIASLLSFLQVRIWPRRLVPLL